MATTEVDGEALRAAARSASRTGEQLSESAAGCTLGCAVNALAGFTSGPALAKAAESRKSGVRALSDELSSLGERLAQAADRYEATDTDAAGGLDRILALLKAGVTAR
ncbi:type VII secretion target [Saccharomonospora xinjiangensis]|uniref:type VII secretion target n=1 Tax=Saccharomonospora xinjiangensis TaxID=75294 RepID=UPI003510957E